MACIWQPPGDGDVFAENGLMRFDRPIQGIYKDCSFIAALSSYLWLQKPSLPPTETVDDVDWRQFIFYKAPRTPGIKIQVTDDLCLPGQASSIQAGEYWPGVWEKAYASFKYWLDDTTLDSLTLPSPPSLLPLNDGGNPVTALVRLKGTPFATFENSSYANADSLFLAIKKKVLGSIVTVPMAAWTYPSADDAPEGVEYADDQIPANHSYSLLGLHYPPDGGKYVVLRNPYGYGLGEPTTDTVTGTWPVVNSIWGITSVELGGQDGIFALEIDAFRRYFQGFGWVSIR